MLKARPVMEGRHEVRKSLSLWHLSKKWVVSLVNTSRPKCFFSARGENGPWWTRRAGGKVWNRMRKRAASWVVGHFPSRSVVEMPDIRGASRLVKFAVFCLRGNPILNLVPNLSACSATVADRSAMRGRAEAGKQLSSCGRLQLNKAGKDYESAEECRECFLKPIQTGRGGGGSFSSPLELCLKLCRFKTVDAMTTKFGDFSWNLSGNIFTLATLCSPTLTFP